MAPILSTAVGVTPQIIDDPRLQKLLRKLNEYEPKGLYQPQNYQSSEEVIAPLDDIEELVAVLEPYQKWMFEEQVDLHEWINALNAIDACLAYFIQKYPSLLLIGPVKRKRGRGTMDAHAQFVSAPAESVEATQDVSPDIVNAITVLLRFLCSLLRNSSSKSVFNSVEELTDLLAAADDTVASLALEGLCNLATPPCLHKQQSPEVNQHTTLLHSSKTASHRRLIALARGWGTRGAGLGLYTCVTTDDSEFGQGSLPARAGELDFSFSANKTTDSANEDEKDAAMEDGSDYEIVSIHLSASEIVEDPKPSSTEDIEMTNMEDEDDTTEASNKRRRVGPVHSGAKTTKSTAELFFTCLEKAGGRSKIQDDRLFALLADIRLAKSFYSTASRVEAVERRLRALIAILQSHPSQEIMSGYFQAQPELCVELIDLLRPTVSSANVSAASSSASTSVTSHSAQDALGALSSSPGVPYSIRMLAVESLTALVGRRDGTTGALTGAARHSSVLSELGVGKGQYLGLLPTLIRYSLASLGSSFVSEQAATQGDSESSTGDAKSEIDALDVGLAFVEATREPAAPRLVQLERALEFIDVVLTLTSAIVSTPTGTSALTDCGLIPALLTTAATDSQSFLDRALPNATSYSNDELLRVKSFLRFITAQAIQILEGAIVTHNNALSAFHDLHGVEVLTSRLSKEVSRTRSKSTTDLKEQGTDEMDCEATQGTSSDQMDCDPSEPEDGAPRKQRILSSQRVLLFSIVTCLTVVFHQESTTSTSATAPSGGAQLRKPELTRALIDIMDDVTSYGGHLASLIATLLSDVLNSDPHVVHHVHKSGIAGSFLNMLIGKRTRDENGVEEYEPILPPVPELMMALPNVISALALTEDGAKAVKEANPFPAMLRLFRHPNYAMPKSRCLLNEMTAIVGTGLDEVMRHVQSLKPLVVSAIADALNRIVAVADDLMKREEVRFDGKNMAGMAATDLENERSCLMQYVLNFGQLLEQILHNEDHCEPFVSAGGLDALLKLFPAVMPTGYQFLSHVSSLSCPAVSTLHHSTAEESLCLAFKCISLRYDPLKLIKTTVDTLKLHVDDLEETQTSLRQNTSAKSDDMDIVRIDAAFVLEGIPSQPLHRLSTNEDRALLTSLSKYLRAVSNVQWASSLLGVAIKTACQRNQDSASGWSVTERAWKKELSTKDFEQLVGKLSTFHQSAIFEVCRVRSADSFAERERARLDAQDDRNGEMRYRLRIVCPEGAVVRDGIEIDSCASVGSMESGEIAEAFDRCVNSSGILRYRTRRGWVSEMTRGHGREPVAEVMAFWQHEGSDKLPEGTGPSPSSKKRIEAPVPDLNAVGASVLARLQTSYSELFNALSKSVLQGLKSIPATSVSFKEGDAGEHAATMMRMLSSNVQQGLNRCKESHPTHQAVNAQGIAMYLGCMISHLQACLFEEKRERRMVNVPLLLYLMETNDNENPPNSYMTLLDAIRFIFKQSLTDFAQKQAEKEKKQYYMADPTVGQQPIQRIDRTVAASFPAAISLLRRLMSGTTISSSPASSILSRIKRSDLALLLGMKINGSGFKASDDDEALFSPEDFVKSMQFTVSEVVRETWVDPRFVYSPPHIVHPFVTLIGDIVGSLEDAGKKRTSQRTPRSAATDNTNNQWGLFRGGAPPGRQRAENVAAAAAPPAAEEVFEPSEDAIARLAEMGFELEHARDALLMSQSNRVELAMEYALSHPPPSAATIERRRVQREERQRQRDEAERRAQVAENIAGETAGETGDENQGEPDAGAAGENGETVAAPDAPADQNEAASEGMDVDQDAEALEENAVEDSADKKDETEISTEKKDTKEEENGDVARASVLLQEWMKDAPNVTCKVLGGLVETSTEKDNVVSMSDGQALLEGDAEGETLTVVLSSFLLDLCQRYSDRCDQITTEVLQMLKAQLERGPDDSFRVRGGKERSFAALCQAAVLFARALPKTRILVLKENLVHMIVSCVQGSLKLADHNLPIWLASAILMLDVMAQPVVGFSDPQQKNVEEKGDKAEDDCDPEGEYQSVREHHKQQAAELTETAGRIFSAAIKIPASATEAKIDPKDKGADNGSIEDADSSKDAGKDDAAVSAKKTPHESESANSKAEKMFSSIPPYFPLLPADVVNPCMEICLDLLRKGRGSDDSKVTPLPGVVHATMLLLLRLLRTPKMSAKCLSMGAAETILSLSKKCRFTGNSGLVTLILRRLLEDEPTLQAAMETEIRGTITKLFGKKRQESDTEPLSVPHRAFAQAVTPLLCRDPLSFLKAFLLTVKIESRGGDTMVKLLTLKERTQNQKALADVIKSKKSVTAVGLPSTNTKTPARKRSLSQSKHKKAPGNTATKTKNTPQRQSSSKRNNSSKKHKRDKKGEKEEVHYSSQPNASPANHIVALLISNIMSSCGKEKEKEDDRFPDDKAFLWTANLLEILADLVLAVPACAMAVQKFRPQRTKDRSSSKNGASDSIAHALEGCPNPPKSFLSFLLHTILPQDRWSIRNDQQIWDRTKEEEEEEEKKAVAARKKMAFRVNKVSQSAARLLVALVARPGEGRKRVISELTFALSGGHLGHASSASGPTQLTEKPVVGKAKELHALQAWGELCIGLASPRSNGKNPEGNSSLSLEVIRLMLEHGMAHALLFSIHRVRLHHPMAASTCSALLLPLEILTRGSVADGIKAIVEKDAAARSAKSVEQAKKESGGAATAAPTEAEANDEAMLEEAFHQEAPVIGNPDEDSSDEDDDDAEDNVDMDEQIDEGSAADEEVTSSSESDDSSDESDDDDDDDDDSSNGEDDGEEGSLMDGEDNEDSDGDSDDSDVEEMEEVEDGDWNVNYHNEMPHDNFDDGGEENEMDRHDAGLDEGWTQVAPVAGGGGNILGGHRIGIPGGQGPLTARTRGFIDAAEAMISTLLRNGEIQGDALAELEGSLGIRIMANGRSLRTLGGGEGGPENVFAENIAARLGGAAGENRQSNLRAPNDAVVVGTLPHVHQRSQPGAGYGSRFNETISSMEYVFGGPSVTAGSRNYDLVSPMEQESEVPPNMSQLDLQLFPGGPASAAHARTQHSLHPLLCGVDLPPVNALVSDLLPHGIRCTRRGYMTTRRPGEWSSSSFSSGGGGTAMVLTSNGNIIANRSHHGGLLVSPTRNAAGPVGWTDDGLPFDATASQFSSSFENALRDSMVAVAEEAAAAVERAAEEAAAAAVAAAASDNPPGGDGENEAMDTVAEDAEESHNGTENVTTVVEAESQATDRGIAAGDAVAENAANEGVAAETILAADGEGVASSLVEGLRLSETSPSDEAAASATTAADTSMEDPAAAGDTDNTNENEASEMEAQPTGGDAAAEEAPGVPGEGQADAAEAAVAEPASNNEADQQGQPNSNGLVCPPDVDEEVFNSLPVDMQRDCIEQHRQNTELASQLDSGSSLDPEALAALPEDIRREVIAQEQQERRLRESVPADPSNAEDMDNASFLASLAPELREEILLTADETFLNSLPAGIIAEAQILRERVNNANQRRQFEENIAQNRDLGNAGNAAAQGQHQAGARDNGESGASTSARRKARSGKLRVDRDRDQVVYIPPGSGLTPPISESDVKALFQLLYLLAPVRPARLLQKVFQNFCSQPELRSVVSAVFVKLLHEDNSGARASLDSMAESYATEDGGWRKMVDSMCANMVFPPKTLIGAVPEVLDTESVHPNITLMRRKQGNSTAASIAANLPSSSAGSRNQQHLPQVVATRCLESLMHLCKNSSKFCIEALVSDVDMAPPSEEMIPTTVFDKLLDLLKGPQILKSSSNLESVLALLEACVSPLSHISKNSDEGAEVSVSQRDIDAAAAAGKEWMDVPRVIVAQERLQVLCSILRMETCRDASFTKVNTIVRRLCRVEANRGYVLAELASVAQALGADAVRDLKALRIRLDGAVFQQKKAHLKTLEEAKQAATENGETKEAESRSASSTVTLSTSTSELKLLRVLQTLQALCVDNSEEQPGKKNESAIVTEELVQLLHAMKLGNLWDELSDCLKVVQVLEGVSTFKDEEDQKSGENESNDDASGDEAGDSSGPGKKLKNSSAGLLTRFLPSIEAFFVACASSTRDTPNEKQKDKVTEDVNSADAGLEKLVEGPRVASFVASNKVLLNALVRNNPGLLDKGMRSLVQVPRCRVFLDFDVKRQWFKTSMRRLRQHASRRHGSVRLHIRRKHVFEDAYHQLRLRNADERRGRLHITFRNEEGVDAGGLSREFFGILAKEMFNPNYALFTSTEDGCTFQPNANSNINPDHLSYFRFVGGIVGKAVADGFLLDAHFTRSLYKHMLGLKPTHHDMEAIDPDYYRNLKTILEYDLETLGLDLTFSIVSQSFGRNEVIDLIPDGRNIAVTDERKAEYVSLVCQHRMTTAIQAQINAYLDGFYELVSPELIAIFNPRELELLISGLPDIDVHDLKKNTDYVGWKATDKEIEWFWNVMFSLSKNQKAAFLQFVTGSSKVPLAGFSELQGMRGIQKFSIHKTGGATGSLASAHTCFNTLDLPSYESEDALREKLLYAINEGGGAFMFA